MKSLSHYLRQPHPVNCDCSVCWISSQLSAAPVISQQEHCTDCRPVRVAKVDGRWKVTPSIKCAKHTPSDRPPKYWHVVYDSGKPAPFVPLREPFEQGELL